MAKKKAAAKEVERKVLSNGVILIKYDDGSYALLTPISAEDAEDIFGGEAEDSEDEEEDEDEDESDDEDSDEDDEDEDEDEDSAEDAEDEEDEDEEDEDEDEDEDDGVTPEDLAGMDFEALEDLCDDKELETDPDEFDEEDVEKLRKAVAKELGITLPKVKAASKKDTKKNKK